MSKFRPDKKVGREKSNEILKSTGWVLGSTWRRYICMGGRTLADLERHCNYEMRQSSGTEVRVYAEIASVVFIVCAALKTEILFRNLIAFWP